MNLFAQSQSSAERRAGLAAKSKYFSIYVDSRADIYSILQKLNYQQFSMNPNFMASKNNDVKTILADTLDSIFLEVSDILDSHIYTFSGELKIVFTKDDIGEIYKFYFNKDFHERSFYIYEKNTVYISYSDMTLGMLAHEVAHAVISYYFGVPPPMKIQEVLAGYVEYHLRRKMGDLQ